MMRNPITIKREKYMNSENPNSKSKEQFRVVINRESNEALEAFLTVLEDGNESAKITKSDLANYVFCRLEKFLTQANVSEIKALYFDPKKALEGILKGASDGQELPEELCSAILKHYGLKPSAAERRPRKVSTSQDVDNGD